MIKGRNAWLVLLFLGLWSLGQLQRLQLTPSIAVYAHDFVIVVYLILNASQLGSAAQKLWSKLGAFSKHWTGWFTLVWVGVGLGVAALTGSAVLGPILYITRLAVYVIFAWSLTVTKPWHKADLRFLWLLAGCFFAWLGWLQFFLIPDTRFLAVLGWDPHYYRLIGASFDPGFAGMILILSFVLWQGPAVRLAKHWKLLVSLAFTLAIYVTYSRASYLAFGVALVGLALKAGWQTKDQWRHLIQYVIYGLILVSCVLWLPRPSGEGGNLSRLSTVNARLETGSQALVGLNSYQWLIGRGLFVESSPTQLTVLDTPDHARVPDNFIITVLTGTGGVGLLLLAWWMYRAAQLLWKADRVVLIQLAAVMMHSLFNNTWLEPFILLWILGMLATVEHWPTQKV